MSLITTQAEESECCFFKASNLSQAARAGKIPSGTAVNVCVRDFRFYALTCVNSRASGKFRNVLNRHVGQAELAERIDHLVRPELQSSSDLQRAIFFGRAHRSASNPSTQHVTFPRCSHDYCARAENISVLHRNRVLHCGTVGADHRSDPIDLSCRSWRSPLFPLCGDRSPGGRVRWFRRGHVLTNSPDHP